MNQSDRYSDYDRTIDMAPRSGLSEDNAASKKVSMSSLTRNINLVVNDLMKFVTRRANLDEEELRTALCEALANAVIHGNERDPRKKVYVEARVQPRKLVIKIRDEGFGFDYTQLPDPRTEENRRKTHGRGLFLIRHLMDEVHFNRCGNEISLIKFTD